MTNSFPRAVRYVCLAAILLFVTPSFCSVASAQVTSEDDRERALQLLWKDSKPAAALPLLEKLVKDRPDDGLLAFSYGFALLAKVKLLKDPTARKQTRIEFRETASAGRAGPLGRKHCLRHAAFAIHQSVERRDHMRHAFAVLECELQAFTQCSLVRRADMQIRDRQFDGVLLEPVDARELLRRQKFAVDAQIRKTLVVGPLGKIGIDAFAIHHQWRHEADMLPLVVAHDARGNCIRTLRFDRHHAIGAMLCAQLHEQQAQEMMDFGKRADGTLAPPAAGALLDRHRRRNAVDRVDVRSRGNLHKLTRVGVQRFEVAALAFAEHDVEGQRGFAAAGYAGDYRELAARQRKVDVLEIVLARVVDFY